MARANGNGVLAERQQQAPVNNAPRSLAAVFNGLIDSEGYSTRIKELMGKRAPQFATSLCNIVNSNPQMMEVARNNPVSIIQAALKAAAMDLPIDPALGLAYVLPFNEKDSDGNWHKKAQFIIGYRGLYNLAMRTGAYEKLNVVDVREGELASFDRMTEDVEISWIEDDEERESKPIIGWLGYFRLVNGMTKTLYMSVKTIKAHEMKNRKGKYQNPIWKDTPDNQANFQAMCAKTVLRKLISKWGVVSIDYQMTQVKDLAATTAVIKGEFDDEDTQNYIDLNATAEPTRTVNTETGEVVDATIIENPSES